MRYCYYICTYIPRQGTYFLTGSLDPGVTYKSLNPDISTNDVQTILTALNLNKIFVTYRNLPIIYNINLLILFFIDVLPAYYFFKMTYKRAKTLWIWTFPHYKQCAWFKTHHKVKFILQTNVYFFWHVWILTRDHLRPQNANNSHAWAHIHLLCYTPTSWRNIVHFILYLFLIWYWQQVDPASANKQHTPRKFEKGIQSLLHSC